MFYTGIEGIGTNDVSATASVSHHVNLALHWTIARQGSQFTSCTCIYAEGHLLIFFMPNGGMKDFGDRQYGMQVSLRIGLPEADRPINHLTCPSGVVLNVTEHAPPPSLMNHIPHLCLALLLENNTRRQTAPLHHRTVLYPHSLSWILSSYHCPYCQHTMAFDSCAIDTQSCCSHCK